MRARTRNPFLTVRTEGAILPADVLARVASADKDLDGLSPEAYHLAKNERINEVATRAWNRLQGAWEAFREAAKRLPEGDLGTSLTRERWLLILFQELGYGRLMTHRAWEIEGRTYPISHLWGSTPIHLVGCNVKMDSKQAGVAGAARVSPHSLVQEFLNRSDDHLWGIVSNGLTLRILRNNVSLTRQAYVEFDLEAMMEGEAFSDFVLLFLVCHQSRVEVPQDKTPASCWLERWHNAAAEQGIRALDELRDGVKSAIDTLGAGFLAHPANTGLRQKLKDGALSTQDYYRQLLRVVYRLLFLFVAEDRDLLYDPEAPLENRAVYATYYATRRIRELAQRRRGTKHADLYRSLRLVFEKLREGCPELALPALGSFLFSGDSSPDLDTVDIANRDLLAAFRQLACTVDGDALRPIDYRNLGPEELGSVYESLLEMHPRVNTDAATFSLEVAAGSERKTTGSFYTHSSLVQCLLDSALDPVLDEAVKKPDPEAALLNLKICDPASGSGHFLIAAAHRVAKRLAAVRTGEDEPSPEATRAALRDVIGRCIYGVDINPMAVELCKISLWMEAMEPGKTLGFLDHHIQCGNSLLGTTPALMANGIPDDAFKPIEGDDKTVCKDLKAQNKLERAGRDMFSAITEQKARADLSAPFAELLDDDDASLDALARKAERYRTLVHSTEYENAWFLADAWCAAFVLPKTSLDALAVTHRRFRTWEADPEKVREDDRKTIRQIAGEYQFFHWHLAFPEVFLVPGDAEEPENEQCGWSGGFSCVIGNPPYVDSETLVREAPRERKAIGELHRTTFGNWDIYIPFVERSIALSRVNGTAAMVTPIQITGSDYSAAIQDLMLKNGLMSCHDFSDARPFQDSDAAVCVCTVRHGSPGHDTEFVKYDVNLAPVSRSRASRRTLRALPSGYIAAPLATEDHTILQWLALPNRLKDLAKVSDGATTSEAYQIRELVKDDDQADAGWVRLVNTGTIDPFSVLWGSKPIRYLGFTGMHPVVAASDLESAMPRRYEQAMSVKLIVAGMSRRLEAAVAERGILCGKSAVLVQPHAWVDPFALAAILNAPAVTALYRALFGSRGFGRGSLNIGPRQLEQLPIPVTAVSLEYRRETGPEGGEMGRTSGVGVSDLAGFARRAQRYGADDSGPGSGISSSQMVELDKLVRAAYEREMA